MRNHKNGFTLMELTIVLAILAIIAAILIPMFLTTTDRARLRSDIQSARVIQNAIELYRVETGQTVAGGTDVSQIMRNLETAGYLNLRNASIQTEGAEWVTDSLHGVRVNITNSPESVRRAYTNLPLADRQMVVGG